MVQVSFDTNHDSVEDLEHALNILQTAIGKKRGVTTNAPVHHEPHPEPAHAPAHAARPAAPHAPKLDMAPMQLTEEEETILDTPFLKIKAHDDHKDHKENVKVEVKEPTLNQLLEEASLSDDDFAKLFKEQMDAEPKQEKKAASNNDGYIEIVEYAEEK